MSKKLLLASPLIILLTIAIIGIVSLYKHNQNRSIEDKLQSGEEILLPKFSLPDLYDSQKIFSNQDLKGKYSLINVFASWCVSCVAEHNLLMELSRKNSINIYGVAWRDINQNTKNYLTKNGNPYLKIGVDGKGIFSKILSVNGTPESFIVNDQGRIIYYQKGAIDKRIFNFLNR